MEWLIGLVLIAIAAIGALLALVSRYRRCPSNKILVIYGKTSSGADYEYAEKTYLIAAKKKKKVES